MPSPTDVYMASRQFARAANIDPMDLGTQSLFYVQSKSRPGVGYWMTHTPEGFAVHQGFECEAEHFHGVLGCWHSKQFQVAPDKEKEMTSTAVAVVEKSLIPARIEFTDEQLKTIADVLCVAMEDGRPVRAPESFVQLFLAACRHTGLDPFLRQIYAMKLKGKWTIFVGVDGHRVVSQRTGLDDGMDGPEWSNDGVEWFDYPFEKSPKLCRVGIWRKGVKRPYVATLRMDSRINANADSWQKDPSGMLAKCCEVLARRRAFPADMAVLDDLISEDVLDVDTGAPMTRAEVPEGHYRELPEGFGEQDGAKAPAQVEHEQNIVKDLNLDADREKAAAQPAKAPAARKAPAKAKAAPEAPVAQDEPASVQEAYDKAFAEQRAAEFAGEQPSAFRQELETKAAQQEADVVARPEPPQGEPQDVPNAPETKAQEMSKFWLAAKRFQKDTGKIIAASKEHFGAVPAELEGIRRVQLLRLLETGEAPPQDDSTAKDHDAIPTYTEDGVMVCETCEAELDEETGKHK